MKASKQTKQPLRWKTYIFLFYLVMIKKRKKMALMATYIGCA